MASDNNSRFISLKDKGRNYLDTLTGETVSKRQRDNALRGGLSNEKAATLNRVTNLDLALSRPARGRKSILKKGDVEKEFILLARKEAERVKKEQEEKAKTERDLQRMLQRKSTKTVKFKHFRDSILKPGSKGARLSFNSYDEYVTLANEVRRSGNVIAYGLGMVGYHESTGEDYGVTVFTLRSANSKPLDEETFDIEFEEAIESRSYFRFLYYFMHAAFKKEYFEKVFNEHKAKLKSGSVKARKPKKRKAKRK